MIEMKRLTKEEIKKKKQYHKKRMEYYDKKYKEMKTMKSESDSSSINLTN
jgi:hypothetical protein